MKFNIAILSSGAGSNCINICEYFKGHESIFVSKVITNNPNSPLISSLYKEVPVIVTNGLTEELFHNIDFIILAGWLKLVPENIVDRFENKILNIHPSLLPDYGGKGMYGQRVHDAVRKAGETMSGITIHLVNKEYDKGKILFQKVVFVDDDLEKNIRKAEHKHYPQIIEKFILCEM